MNCRRMIIFYRWGKFTAFVCGQRGTQWSLFGCPYMSRCHWYFDCRWTRVFWQGCLSMNSLVTLRKYKVDRYSIVSRSMKYGTNKLIPTQIISHTFLSLYLTHSSCKVNYITFANRSHPNTFVKFCWFFVRNQLNLPSSVP